jgi:hypothetical protein
LSATPSGVPAVERYDEGTPGEVSVPRDFFSSSGEEKSTYASPLAVSSSAAA